jgi:hypothetical protein
MSGRQARIIFISRSVKFYYRSDHISYMYVKNCYITIKLSMLLLECSLRIWRYVTSGWLDFCRSEVKLPFVRDVGLRPPRFPNEASTRAEDFLEMI